MRLVDYDSFVERVKFLEKNNIIIKKEMFGYKKRFIDVLIENGLALKKENAFYVKSILNDKVYCFTSGQFIKHLHENKTTEFEYLRLNGIRTCFGYVVNFKGHGKDCKRFFEKLQNGQALYFAYRSILTSVSSDYRKLMFFYDCSEQEAKEISSKKHKKRRDSHIGEKNNSYGKRGLNANCFSPFLKEKNKMSAYSDFLKERNKKTILRWASDNDVDATCFEDIKFRYYSEMFKNIHKEKGIEVKNRENLKSIEEGIYFFNRKKSIESFNIKSFIEPSLNFLKKFGTEEQEIKAVNCLINEDYHELLALSYSAREMCGFRGERFSYNSIKHGNFNLRSKLEKGFLWILDKLDICENIKYENVRIPYNIEGKKHTYVVDFDILLKSGKRLLIEVKPYRLAIIPEGIILNKKVAAENYSASNNCVYLFVTEKDLKYELLRKKLQSM